MRSPPHILWLGRTHAPGELEEVTIGIGTKRYAYDLLPHIADNAEHIIKVAGIGKALAYIKKFNQGWRKL